MLSTNFPSGGNDTQGINLLTGTKQNDSSTVITPSSSGVSFYNDEDFGVAHIVGRSQAYMAIFYKTSAKTKITNGVVETELIPGKYVFSCDYKTNLSNFEGSQIRIFDKNLANTEITSGTISPISTEIEPDEQWHKMSISFGFGGGFSENQKNYDDCFICFGFVIRENVTPDKYFDIKKPKLERGTVTDPQWSPAPEDLLLKGEVDGRNLFVMNSVMENNFVSSDGKEYPIGNTTKEKTCDYISVTESENLTVKMQVTCKANNWPYWVSFIWYDSGKNYLKGDWRSDNSLPTEPTFSNVTATFTAPANAAYLRVSARFYDDGKIKVERGSIATDWTPAPEDVVTKTPPDIFDALDSIPEMHRNIFRGKNLGTVFTDEQKANIKNGTFHDLWVGDYWVINNHTWRIVDINYWYNKGDQNCTTPHIVVMPDAQLYTHKMNDENVTTGGYYGSLMYTEGLTQAKTIVNTDFGEGFVLNHRVLLTNKVDSGHASAGTWYDSTVELANEIMIYGCSVFSAMNNGTAVPYSYTTEYTQLALFRLVPRFINASRQWYWLRDVVSATNFAHVNRGGHANCASASIVDGVRPVVGITGGTVAADEPDSDLEVTGLSTKGGDPL